MKLTACDESREIVVSTEVVGCRGAFEEKELCRFHVLLGPSERQIEMIGKRNWPSVKRFMDQQLNRMSRLPPPVVSANWVY
ncbi:hypothetical protein [Marinobacter qingdaonensis]|uniref:Uncharacterized protein n=1 Tax=Marinobacter qingdaonensis TaxID=3108486 RepID=A0ABU5NUQ3_9GAMM|nr:hypothetical protein [Marinobacter sp. ASW11-75]MEA1079538.1 hypothetical protein [Marinobacter sp. ASW11-75]